MTNISKLNIHTEDFKIVTSKLHLLISKLNAKSAHLITSELLTESEQIMVTKRFGAIFMYSQHYTPYRVSQTLGLSVPTASRIYENYTQGSFDKLLDCLTKKQSNEFLQLLEDLIAAQASPRARARLLNRAIGK